MFIGERGGVLVGCQFAVKVAPSESKGNGVEGLIPQCLSIIPNDGDVPEIHAVSRGDEAGEHRRD